MKTCNCNWYVIPIVSKKNFKYLLKRKLTILSHNIQYHLTTKLIAEALLHLDRVVNRWLRKWESLSIKKYISTHKIVCSKCFGIYDSKEVDLLMTQHEGNTCHVAFLCSKCRKTKDFNYAFKYEWLKKYFKENEKQ